MRIAAGVKRGIIDIRAAAIIAGYLGFLAKGHEHTRMPKRTAAAIAGHFACANADCFKRGCCGFHLLVYLNELSMGCKLEYYKS